MSNIFYLEIKGIFDLLWKKIKIYFISLLVTFILIAYYKNSTFAAEAVPA
jgi:hypothetical protein